MGLRVLAPGLACLMLAACSTGTEYRKAEMIQPMETPSGMAFEGGEALYSVPNPDQRKRYDEEDDKFVVPEPPQVRAPIADSEDEDAEADEPGPDADIETRITRDGNGYPIIMMRTRFAWAWARVDEALAEADIRVNDRDRASGLFYVRLPEGLEAEDRRVRIKLSQTANGIQVAVLRRKSEQLLAREPAQALLEQLHEEL